MRQIKFRGKRISTGSWIYGYLVGKSAIRTTLSSDTISSGEYLVEHETVGQFTGLHDCNGKEIYEGSILYFPEIDERTEVVFDEGAFRILFSFNDESEVLTNKILDANYDVEVIGDIHTTPELIKESA